MWHLPYWCNARRERKHCRPCLHKTAGFARPCVRCEVGSFRLVSRRLCASCYNRQREWSIGRNKKGGRDYYARITALNMDEVYRSIAVLWPRAEAVTIEKSAAPTEIA